MGLCSTAILTAVRMNLAAIIIFAIQFCATSGAEMTQITLLHPFAAPLHSDRRSVAGFHPLSVCAYK